MPDAATALLASTARFVTEADIAAFAPNDPGYPGYVATWTRLLLTQRLAATVDFNISETVNLTLYADPGRESDPQRFRRFRTFTNAAALALYAHGAARSDDIPGNYLAINLIDDAHALADPTLLALLPPAFEELHTALVRQHSEEAPFVLLACLLIRLQLQAPASETSALAERIMAEEARFNDTGQAPFLWACTVYDRFHPLWRHHVSRLLIPTCPSTTLLREALLLPP